MVLVVKKGSIRNKNDDKRRGRGCVIDGFYQPDCFCGVIRKVLEMNFVIDFWVTKALASIEVEADSKEEAEDIAWHEFENITVGELKKMEVDMEMTLNEM